MLSGNGSGFDGEGGGEGGGGIVSFNQANDDDAVVDDES